MPTPHHPLIESARNPRVQGWKRLHTVKGRGEAGLFLAEGPHLAEEAARAGCLVEVIAREDADVPEGARVVRVSEAVMKAVAETTTPQGVIGVCRADGLPKPTTRGHWLLLDGVQDPGHVGTMIRTAHAAGFGGVGLGAGCADALSAKALRASQGSVFHIGVRRGGMLDFINDLQHAGHVVVGSALSKSAVDYRLLDGVRTTFAVVVGNEGAGVSTEVLDQCDKTVFIPMPGGAESLSVPVAAGVLMFQLVQPKT